MLLFGAGTLFADQDPSQLLLNVDGILGDELHSSVYTNDALSGGKVGVEWLAAPFLGLDLDYEYLSIGKSPYIPSDNDIIVSMRILPVSFGNTTLMLLGGAGYNTTRNNIDTNFIGYVGPGIRVALAPSLALDAGVEYQLTAPREGFRQALEATIGISIPLYGSFTVCGSAPAAPVAATEVPTEVVTEVATPVATPAPAPTGLLCYVVQKGDYLWKIAGDPSVFGDSRLWPLLLETNNDKIENQDFLKPGLILSYKRSYTTSEIAAARKKEWFTPAFEPPEYLRGNPLP